MKKKLLYLATSAMAMMSLVGCNDLDTQPMSRYVTDIEKQQAINANPELASAGVVGISATYNQFQAVYEAHFDFGWPGVMLMLESIGPDLVADNIGYNWFAPSGNYNYGTDDNYMTNMLWFYAYKIIRASNAVLKNIDEDSSDAQLQLYASQGYANRAYAYFMLAQLYQKTYKGNENLPCVPVVTVENSDQAATEGCPRSTVEEVYRQILSDLDTSIRLLDESGLTVDNIAEIGEKRFISLGTAYGLRARVNLVMNNWQAAAADAAMAIAESGATPLSIAEASKPGFSSSSEHNWMWCVYIQENDRVVTSGIINFPSHMGSFNYGYASVGAWRKINIALFNDIPTSDCRRGWFLDSNGSSVNISSQQKVYVSKNEIPPYTQVKFAPYEDVLGTATNACDIPLMRVEEMYLIQAEAEGMTNPAAGKTILENFVKTYRNPRYTCTATDAASLQEEVWKQRRVELWGEGFAYTDLLRLNKGLDRRGGGWASEWVYNVQAPLKPLLIPHSEMENNLQIGSNNDTWSRPTSVTDL